MEPMLIESWRGIARVGIAVPETDHALAGPGP